MRTNKFLLIIILIGVIVIIGAVFLILMNSTAEANTTSNPTSLPTEQRNILFIIVDRIEKPHPELLSTWLVLSLESSQVLNFMPIAPRNSLASNSRVNGEPTRAVLTGSGTLDPGFKSYIESKGIQWHEFVVVDSIAIAGFIDLLGGVALDSQMYQGFQFVSGEYITGEDPAASLLHQAKVLDEVCRGIPLLSIHPDLETTTFNLLKHSQSSLQISDFQQFFSTSSFAGLDPECVFPNMKLKRTTLD